MRYQDPDKYVHLNRDDRHLFEIKVDILGVIQRTYREYNLTEPKKFPAKNKIANYGQKPENQVFTREIYPQRLRDLERKVRNDFRTSKIGLDRREQEIINEFWIRLSNDADSYTEEIDWIRRAWYHRLFGYWFYCNGKPTYIVGAHWFFLNFWYLDDILPEYRDVDRRWWVGQQHFKTDTTTFKDIDPDSGMPLQNAKGEYEMVDLGRRVFFGTNNPKTRRVGHTSKAQCDNTEYSTRTTDSHIGIQGKDEDNAENVFKNHFVRPYKKLPIVWKALSSQITPSEIMLFESDGIVDGLNTRSDFATTKHRSAYDGYKLKRLHVDEPGKVLGESIQKRHDVVRNCLGLGSGVKIIGFMQYTTTVDEMDRTSGENYLKLAKGSHYEKRNENGQTATGLVNIFFRAEDGLEGFVGKYGESVVENPTDDQQKYIKNRLGAKQFIENTRKQLLRDKNIEGLIEHKRQHPQTWAEVFTPPAKDTFFRMDILENRIAVLQHEEDPPRRGNLYHKTADKDSDVIWQDDPEGKFYLSRKFMPNETNRRVRENGVYRPMYPDVGVASADTFRVEKTQGGRMSDGSGVWRWKHDATIDPPEKDVKDWITSRAVITYSNRPNTLEEYLEDMLMGCIFTGYPMYPEANIDAIEKHFIRRGYKGYLLYDTDWSTGRPKAYAGFYSHIDVKKKIFNLTANDIALHGHRCRHTDILSECMAIKSIDEMTDYDLFTANGGCLLAEENSYNAPKEEEVDSTDFISQHSF